MSAEWASRLKTELEKMSTAVSNLYHQGRASHNQDYRSAVRDLPQLLTNTQHYHHHLQEILSAKPQKCVWEIVTNNISKESGQTWELPAQCHDREIINSRAPETWDTWRREDQVAAVDALSRYLAAQRMDP